jgi:hypothetical protein
MTPHNQLAQHTAMPARHPAREARARRGIDALVASYIRELAAADDETPRPRGGREAQES